MVPSRTIVDVEFNVTNPEKEEGYVPRDEPFKGLFLGEALVKNSRGKGHIKVYNLTEQNFTIEVNPMPLEDYFIPGVFEKHFQLPSKSMSQEELSNFGKTSDSNCINSEEFPCFTSSTQPPVSKDPKELSIHTNLTSQEELFDYEESSNSQDKKGLSTIPDASPASHSLEGSPEMTNAIPTPIGLKDLLNINDTFPVSPDPKGPFEILDAPPASLNRIKRLQALINVEHINDEEADHVKSVLDEYADCFYLPGENLKFITCVKHAIPTTDNMPVHVKQYRYPPIRKEEIDRQVTKLLKDEIIVPSVSPYIAPLWIVPKKASTENGN